MDDYKIAVIYGQDDQEKNDFVKYYSYVNKTL